MMPVCKCEWGAAAMLLMTSVLGLLLIGLSADLFSFSDEEPVAEGGPDGGEQVPAEVPGSNDYFDPNEFAAVAPVAETGTSGEDILWGAGAGDSIAGGDGDDQINGYGGNDTLSGDGGSDDMHGGAGDDLLAGGEGIDALSGNDGADTLLGGDGNDSLMGGMGDDWLEGGAGDDLQQGGSGADTLLGGDGNDSLQGGEDRDVLHGGLGSDEFFGDAGNDILDGRVPAPGAPQTDLDTGQDLLNGGRGDDLLVLGSNDFGSGGEGADLFAAGDWIDPAHPATILFDPTQDQIALVYDPAMHPSPQVAISPSDAAPDAVWISLDGVALVHVLNGAGLSAADIALMTPDALAAISAT